MFNSRNDNGSFKRKSKTRSEIRFTYPGISTFNFEIILKIVLDNIIGWNSDEDGYFGKAKAYTFTIEEQSRKSLNVHFLLWIEKESIDLTITKNMNVNSENGRDKRNKILKYNDCVQDNSLFGNEKFILNNNAYMKVLHNYW